MYCVTQFVSSERKPSCACIQKTNQKFCEALRLLHNKNNKLHHIQLGTPLSKQYQGTCQQHYCIPLLSLAITEGIQPPDSLKILTDKQEHTYLTQLQSLKQFLFLEFKLSQTCRKKAWNLQNLSFSKENLNHVSSNRALTSLLLQTWTIPQVYPAPNHCYPTNRMHALRRACEACPVPQQLSY